MLPLESDYSLQVLLHDFTGITIQGDITTLEFFFIPGTVGTFLFSARSGLYIPHGSHPQRSAQDRAVGAAIDVPHGRGPAPQDGPGGPASGCPADLPRGGGWVRTFHTYAYRTKNGNAKTGWN